MNQCNIFQNYFTIQTDAHVSLLPDISLVLSSAISGRENFNNYWKEKHIDEIVLQINLVSKDLRDFKDLSKEKKEDLRDFCVRLSKEITSFRNQYYSNYYRLVE